MIPSHNGQPISTNVTPLFEVPRPARSKGPLTRLGEYPWTIGYITIAITIVLVLLLLGHR